MEANKKTGDRVTHESLHRSIAMEPGPNGAFRKRFRLQMLSSKGA